MRHDVCQQAGAVIRKVSPGTVAHRLVRNAFGWPKEAVPVQVRGLWLVRDKALLPGKVVPDRAGEEDLAKLLFCKNFLFCSDVMSAATLLRSALKYLPGMLLDRSGQRGAIFPAVQRRLFQVN